MNPTRMLVVGCRGKLGRAVCAQAALCPQVQVVAGVDTTQEDGDFPVFPTVAATLPPADVVVSCLPPHATHAAEQVLAHALAQRTPLMVCTTGLPAPVMAALQNASHSVAILHSANLSLGVALLQNLAARAAKLLHPVGFDIEIVERHHNQKADAPSGTALLLAHTINHALDNALHVTTGRGSLAENTPRTPHELGLHALRGGSIVGDHTVVLAGPNEIVELSHSALSRDVFGAGAIQAACFMHGKPAGWYTMQDMVDGL